MHVLSCCVQCCKMHHHPTCFFYSDHNYPRRIFCQNGEAFSAKNVVVGWTTEIFIACGKQQLWACTDVRAQQRRPYKAFVVSVIPYCENHLGQKMIKKSIVLIRFSNRKSMWWFHGRAVWSKRGVLRHTLNASVCSLLGCAQPIVQWVQ